MLFYQINSVWSSISPISRWILCIILWSPWLNTVLIAQTSNNEFETGWEVFEQMDPLKIDLNQLGLVQGAVLDTANGSMILIGDGRPYQAVSPTPQLIALALAFAYSGEENHSYLSIDPQSPDPEKDSWQNVLYDKLSINTLWGQICFEADRRMKCFVASQDNLTHSDIDLPIAACKDLFEIRFRQNSLGHNNNRFWLFSDSNSISTSSASMFIDNLHVGVQTRSTHWKNGDLKDIGSRTDPGALEFANCLTHNYELLRENDLVFMQLEQLFRLELIGMWFRYEYLFSMDRISTQELDRNHFPNALKEKLMGCDIDWQNLNFVSVREGEAWQLHDEETGENIGIQRLAKGKIAIYRERSLVPNFQWIDHNRRVMYKTPRMTRAINASRIQGNSKLKLHGGVDMKVIPNFHPANFEIENWSRAALNAAANGQRKFEFEGQNYSIASVPVFSMEMETGSSTVERGDPSNGLNSTDHLSIPRLYWGSPYKLTGVSHIIETSRDKMVKIQNYQLYDANGNFQGQFEAHEVDRSNGEIVILPRNETNDWRLYPRPNGRVQAEKAGEAIIFEESYGLPIEHSHDGVMTYYRWRIFEEEGPVLKEVEDDQAIITSIFGNNGRQVIGNQVTQKSAGNPEISSESEHKQINNMHQIAYSFMDLDFLNTTYELEGGTGNWKKSDNFYCPGLDFPNRNGTKLTNDLDRENPPPLSWYPDGYYIYRRRDRKLTTYPVQTHILHTLNSQGRLPEGFGKVATLELPDGSVALFFQEKGEFYLNIIGDAAVMAEFEGTSAGMVFEQLICSEAQFETDRSVDRLFAFPVFRKGQLHLQTGQNTIKLDVSPGKILDIQQGKGKFPKSVVEAINRIKNPNIVLYGQGYHKQFREMGYAVSEDMSIDPNQLVAIFTQQYEQFPGKFFLLDDDPLVAAYNLDHLPDIDSLADIAVVLKREGFLSDENARLDQMANEFRAKGVNVYSELSDLPNLPNESHVFFVNALEEEELVEYMNDIGKEGKLKDRIIVQMSTQIPHQSELKSQLIARYHNRGMLGFEKKLELEDALETIGEVVGIVKQKAADNPLNIQQLIRQAINHANLKGKSGTLNDMRQHILQISMNEDHGTQYSICG